MYRVGTLLEMVRELAVALAAGGRKVKVCVQQPLGQGVFAVSRERGRGRRGAAGRGRHGTACLRRLGGPAWLHMCARQVRAPARLSRHAMPCLAAGDAAVAKRR